MEEPIEVEGRITAVLAGTMFRAKLENGHEVLAHISGKMRKRFIRLTIGDRVKMEMSPYDLDKARNVYRLRGSLCFRLGIEHHLLLFLDHRSRRNYIHSTCR